MSTPESVEQEAKSRSGEEAAPEEVVDQLVGDSEVAAKGLERRDQSPS